jgi:Fe-S cluster biogenesis protein NfuA
MHVERTDDPDVMRWVVHHPALRLAPPGVRPIADDSRFGPLVDGGSVVEVAMSEGDVLVRAADHDQWRDLAPLVQEALAEALDELDRLAPGGPTSHWLLAAEPARTGSRSPSMADVQRIVDRAAGAVLGAHGGSMTVVAVEAPVVRLRAGGACHGCAYSNETLLGRIEPAILSAFPTLVEVVLEG